ncbi:Protein of unknown function [Pyronema omphalodes CBS 100304]|uniref:Uncharacterized protein n=1 Tax=Pyronema omphalodes (strain CBS 100304) TaxID=1076935 RepID=U4L0B7_PYROM|nr:Protein of unknown function [Pyronema omphalodes CBS 100304]
MLRKLSRSNKSTEIKLKTENKRVSHENDQLKDALQLATTELTQLKQKHDETIKTISAQSANYKNLKNECDRLSDRNAQLLDENSWMKDEMEQLKLGKAKLSHEVNQLRTMNDELSEKNNLLGEWKLYSDNEIKQLQRSEELYKDEIQRLKNEGTKLKGDMMPLKEKYKLLNIGYDELSEDRKRLGDLRVLLQSENDRLTKAKEQAKLEMVQMKEEIIKLKDQHEDSADEISELKNKINDYRDRNVKLKEIMQTKNAAIKPPLVMKDRATAPPSPGKEEFLEEMNDRLMKQIGSLKIEVVALREENTKLKLEVEKADKVAQEQNNINAAKILKNYEDMENRLRTMEKLAEDFDKVTTKLLEKEKQLREQKAFYEGMAERLTPLEAANEDLTAIKTQLTETQGKYEEPMAGMDGYEFAFDKKRLEQIIAVILPQTVNAQGFFCRKVPLPTIPDNLIQISQGYNTTSVPYNVASFAPGHFIYVERERIDKIQKLESLMKIAWGDSLSRARIQFRGLPKGRSDWESFSADIRRVYVVQNLARVNDPDAPDFFMMQCI